MIGQFQRVETPCQETDPEIFFGNVNSSPLKDLNLAISMCKRCDFVEACLETAFSFGDVHGIWGGLTRHGRRLEAKRRGITLSKYYSPANVYEKE